MQRVNTNGTVRNNPFGDSGWNRRRSLENYELTSHGQVVIIEMKVHNVSESQVTRDEHFYYLFGIKHTEEAVAGEHDKFVWEIE